MPICIVCQTKFYDQTFTEPAEPCDCGRCWWHHPEDSEPPDPEALAQARADWANGNDNDPADQAFGAFHGEE